MSFFFSKNPIVPQKGSLIAGGIYWFFYLLGLGLILPPILSLCGMDLTTPKGYNDYNLIYFTLNFIAVLLIFRPFLFRSLQGLKGNLKRCVLSALMAYGLYYVLAMPLNVIYAAFELMPENQNNDAVVEMLQQAPWMMLVATVIFAPVTEECLVRGVLFAPFLKKRPVLGYVISVVVFAGVHVLGSIGTQSAGEIFLCFLQYVPHSIALAWAYHRSGNIFASILLHSGINLLASIAQLSLPELMETLLRLSS